MDCINGFILRSFYSKMKLLFKKKKKRKKETNLISAKMLFNGFD